jgi:hypothetical protein
MIAAVGTEAYKRGVREPMKLRDALDHARVTAGAQRVVDVEVRRG